MYEFVSQSVVRCVVARAGMCLEANSCATVAAPRPGLAAIRFTAESAVEISGSSRRSHLLARSPTNSSRGVPRVADGCPLRRRFDGALIEQ